MLGACISEQQRGGRDFSRLWWARFCRARSGEIALRRSVGLGASSPRPYLLLINALALQEKLPGTLRAMDDYLSRFPGDAFAAQVRTKRDLLNKQLQSSKKPSE